MLCCTHCDSCALRSSDLGFTLHTYTITETKGARACTFVPKTTISFTTKSKYLQSCPVTFETDLSYGHGCHALVVSKLALGPQALDGPLWRSGGEQPGIGSLDGGGEERLDYLQHVGHGASHQLFLLPDTLEFQKQYMHACGGETQGPAYTHSYKDCMYPRTSFLAKRSTWPRAVNVL